MEVVGTVGSVATCARCSVQGILGWSQTAMLGAGGDQRWGFYPHGSCLVLRRSAKQSSSSDGICSGSEWLAGAANKCIVVVCSPKSLPSFLGLWRELGSCPDPEGTNHPKHQCIEETQRTWERCVAGYSHPKWSCAERFPTAQMLPKPTEPQ